MGRWIIHLFAITPAVLGEPVGFLPFRCLAVLSLGFPAYLLSALGTALTAAVGMAPEALVAEIEGDLAKAAAKLDEKHKAVRELANGRGHGTTRKFVGLPYACPYAEPKVMPEVFAALRAFSLSTFPGITESRKKCVQGRGGSETVSILAEGQDL